MQELRHWNSIPNFSDFFGNLIPPMVGITNFRQIWVKRRRNAASNDPVVVAYFKEFTTDGDGDFAGLKEYEADHVVLQHQVVLRSSQMPSCQRSHCCVSFHCARCVGNGMWSLV